MRKLQRLFALLGIHLHKWHYYMEYDPKDLTSIDNMRECYECGTRERWIFNCGIPAMDTGGWLAED